MTGAVAIKKLTAAAAESAARLATLWQPLKKVLTFSIADEALFPAKCLSVSIEKGVLSVAYGSRLFSKIRIRGHKSYPLEGDFPTPEGLASSVALAVDALGVPKAEITLGIPKTWAVIRNAEFPSTVAESISDVLSYEIDRFTPFKSEEAFYDFRVVSGDGEKLCLLLAAVKADLLSPYVSALEEKGFTVKRVTVNLSSVGTLCRFADKCMDSVFVKVKEKEYEGTVFSEGYVTSAFAGSFGAADERARLDAIMAEIDPLMEAQKKEGKSPTVMVSLRDRNPSFKEMLKLKAAAPLEFLEETEIPLGVPARDIPYEAAGGVVESLWPKARGLNLLAKGRREKERQPVAVSIVLVAALVVLGIIYLVSPLRIEGNRIQEIDRQIDMRKEDVRKVEALKKDIENAQAEISTIEDFRAARPMTLTIIRELTTILPKSAWLTRVRITETTVEIEGYASSATELLPKLEASKYLQKVEFSSPTFRDARMNADRFNIKMEIEGVKKKEEEKTKTAEKAKAPEKPKKEGEKPKR